MGRKPFRTTDEKVAVVLSVLKGDMTQVEAGRRMELPRTTISKWLKQFIEAGREVLDRGDNPRKPSSKREGELEEKVEEATAAGRGLRGVADLAKERERGGSLPATRT